MIGHIDNARLMPTLKMRQGGDITFSPMLNPVAAQIQRSFIAIFLRGENKVGFFLALKHAVIHFRRI